MTQRDDKERTKTSREALGKYFYDLSKASFTAIFIVAIVSLFFQNTAKGSSFILLFIGFALTVFLASIAYYILNHK